MQDHKPSTTAQIVTFLRAVLSTPIGGNVLDDPFARLFLRPPFALLFRATQGPLAPLFYRALIATTGATGNICVRTRYFDGQLEKALAEGSTQVVILGAGYDTRALRFAKGGIPFFEVDHPATQSDKQKQLALHRLPAPVFVTVDFTKDDLVQKLEEVGFIPTQRTFFLWEGVTMYLTEPEVRATLRAIKQIAAPGSILSFDATTGDISPSADQRRTRLRSAAVAFFGEPWKLWMTKENIPEFLQDEAWRCLEMLSPKELTERYIPRDALYSVPPNKFLITAGV
jgi:methyltransferase (TIGR00027 family)